MGLNTDCPRCGHESAFHNGTCYECPECDYEWGCIEEEEDDLDNDLQESEDD